MALWVDKVVPSLLSFSVENSKAYRKMLEMYLGWTEVFRRKTKFVSSSPVLTMVHLHSLGSLQSKATNHSITQLHS